MDNLDQKSLEVLGSRERRTVILKDLLENCDLVITVSLNVPGINKRDKHKEQFIKKLFFKFEEFIESKCEVIETLNIEDKAGYIYYILVNDINPINMKKVAIDFENKLEKFSPLIDIDVYKNINKKITRDEVGFEQRKCWLCNNQAKVCSFKKTHDIQDLEIYSNRLFQLHKELGVSERFIVQDIIGKISKGEILEGDRLVEEKLADTYSVSRTIIRGAIKELVSTQLVTSKKNVGVTIKKLSKNEISEIGEMRFVMEKLIYENVLNSLNENRVEIFKNMYDSMIKIDVTNSEDVLLWNKKYNNLVYSLANNYMIKKLSKKVNQLFTFIRYKINWLSPERSISALQEHTMLCDAFIKKDLNLLMDRLNQHLEKSKQNIIGIINNV